MAWMPKVTSGLSLLFRTKLLGLPRPLPTAHSTILRSFLWPFKIF